MDIVVPLTRRGNKYILVIIDQFTKWIECYALPNQEAESVAKKLAEEFILRFGCPLELHTDQGKNVDGSVIRNLCKKLQIARTTPYRPCSNGQVERYKRLVLQILRCYTGNKQNTWDEYLNQCSAAIRATRQTGFTPNKLMLGREVTQPADIMFRTVDFDMWEDESDYVEGFVGRMSHAHQLARENIRRHKSDRRELMILIFTLRNTVMGRSFQVRYFQENWSKS